MSPQRQIWNHSSSLPLSFWNNSVVINQTLAHWFCIRLYLEDHWNRLLGPISSFWFSRSGWGLCICISNKFPGNSVTTIFRDHTWKTTALVRPSRLYLYNIFWICPLLTIFVAHQQICAVFHPSSLPSGFTWSAHPQVLHVPAVLPCLLCEYWD